MSPNNVGAAGPAVTSTESAGACLLLRNVNCIYQCRERDRKEKEDSKEFGSDHAYTTPVGKMRDGEVGSTVRTRALCLLSRATGSRLGIRSNCPDEKARLKLSTEQQFFTHKVLHKVTVVTMTGSAMRMSLEKQTQL